MKVAKGNIIPFSNMIHDEAKCIQHFLKHMEPIIRVRKYNIKDDCLKIL